MPRRRILATYVLVIPEGYGDALVRAAREGGRHARPRALGEFSGCPGVAHGRARTRFPRSSSSRFSSAPTPHRARSFPGRLRCSLLASRSVSPSLRQRASRWVTSSSCSFRPTRYSAERRCSLPGGMRSLASDQPVHARLRAAGIPEASRARRSRPLLAWVSAPRCGLPWASSACCGAPAASVDRIPRSSRLHRCRCLPLRAWGRPTGTCFGGLGAKGDAVHGCGQHGFDGVDVFWAARGSRRRAWARR